MAFGMRVVYWSPSSRDGAFTYAELDELLAIADVVTLHVALSDTTRGLLDARRLALMKPDAILVNTARGALVDERAVAEALTGSRLGRYAADVLAEEPPGEDSPLPGHPHTVITPHTGGLTNLAYREMCVSTSENVLRILRGRGARPGLGRESRSARLALDAPARGRARDRGTCPSGTGENASMNVTPFGE